MVDIEIKNRIFKDIYSIIDQIKRCRSKSRYSLLKNSLDTLYELCDYIGIDDYPLVENYSYKSYGSGYEKHIDNFYNQLIENEEYNLLFSNNQKLFDRSNPDKLVYHFNNKVDMAQNINYSLDFLKQYNIKIYNDLKEAIKDCRVLCSASFNTGRDGSIYNACDIFKPYIVIEQSYNIDDSVAIVHESGHYYAFQQEKGKSNKVKQKNQFSQFEEVYSHYISLIYMNYLKENKILLEDIPSLHNSVNDTLYYFLKDLSKIYKGEIEDINDQMLALSYSYGITIAYHFYDMYLRDRELAEYTIHQFIGDDGIIPPMQMLEKYNLKDELIDSKILKKYI